MCGFGARRPSEQVLRRFNVPGRPVTDMGLSTDPAWMRVVLNELGTLGKPVYITENGLATDDDEWRGAFFPQSPSPLLLAARGSAALPGSFPSTTPANYPRAGRDAPPP